MTFHEAEPSKPDESTAPAATEAPAAPAAPEAPEALAEYVEPAAPAASAKPPESAAPAAKPALRETPDVDSDAAINEWLGRMNDLHEQPWYKSAPPAAQAGMRQGIESVLKGYQAAYTAKTQEVADARKEVEAAMQKAYDLEARATRIMFGDEDPAAAVHAELVEAEARLKTALERAEAERTTVLSAKDTELSAIKAEYEAGKTSWTEAKAQYEATIRGYVQTQTAAEVDSVMTWLKGVDPALGDDTPGTENDPAWHTFVSLLNAHGREKALKMTRAVHPAAPTTVKPTPKAVPASVSMMNMGQGADSATTAPSHTETLDEKMNRMRIQAQEEYAASLMSE